MKLRDIWEEMCVKLRHIWEEMRVKLCDVWEEMCDYREKCVRIRKMCENCYF